MRIFKYPVEAHGVTAVMMPRGARILSFGVQGSTPVVWALADESQAAEPRGVCVVFTGEAPPDGSVFVGSATIARPDLLFPLVVLHCFAEPN